MTHALPETSETLMLDLAARLPDGYRDLGVSSHRKEQAQFYVSYDAGDELWEIEFCALDQDRNFIMQGDDLEELLRQARQRDREAAPNV